MKRTWKGLCLLLCILFVAACVPKTAYAAAGVQAQAAAVSGTVIEVKWNALDQAAEYAIYRRTSSDADFIKIAQTAALSYRDTGISAGISYYYKIVPISRANGKEMKSAQSTVKTKAPSDVTIERIRVKSQNALQISWSVSEGASGYQIFRSERETGGYKEIGRVNGKTSLRYTDTNVIPGRTYFYRVRPTNQGHTGCGSDSAPYKARTLGQTKITSIASLASDRMQVTWKKVSGAQTYECTAAPGREADTGGLQRSEATAGNIWISRYEAGKNISTKLSRRAALTARELRAATPIRCRTARCSR